MGPGDWYEPWLCQAGARSNVDQCSRVRQLLEAEGTSDAYRIFAIEAEGLDRGLAHIETTRVWADVIELHAELCRVGMAW